MPHKLKWDSTLLYPAFGNSVWIFRKTESRSSSDISVRVPRIKILNSRSRLLTAFNGTDAYTEGLGDIWSFQFVFD